MKNEDISLGHILCHKAYLDIFPGTVQSTTSVSANILVQSRDAYLDLGTMQFKEKKCSVFLSKFKPIDSIALPYPYSTVESRDLLVLPE
jgi:hypothetical protein